MKITEFKDMLNATWIEVSEATRVNPARLSAIGKGKMPTTQECIDIQNGTRGCVRFDDLVGDFLE